MGYMWGTCEVHVGYMCAYLVFFEIVGVEKGLIVPDSSSLSSTLSSARLCCSSTRTDCRVSRRRSRTPSCACMHIQNK